MQLSAANVKEVSEQVRYYQNFWIQKGDNFIYFYCMVIFLWEEQAKAWISTVTSGKSLEMYHSWSAM